MRPWPVQADARLGADHLFALESTGSTASRHSWQSMLFNIGNSLQKALLADIFDEFCSFNQYMMLQNYLSFGWTEHELVEK